MILEQSSYNDVLPFELKKKKVNNGAFHCLLRGFDIFNHSLHTHVNPKLSSDILMLVNKLAVFR